MNVYCIYTYDNISNYIISRLRHDIYYATECNYSLDACLLNLVMCVSIASCLGGHCDCAMFLGMLSGSLKWCTYSLLGVCRRVMTSSKRVSR